MIRAAVADDPAAPVAIPAIAAAAGVSQRTLERAFRRAVGRSPQAYLLHLRLEAARQTLAAGEAASVLDAATQHGFGHPGRFAIAYARAFGEAPSATLHAARLRPPATHQVSPVLGWIVLRPLDGTDATAARHATDALAMALAGHRTLALCDPSARPSSVARALYRLQGRIEGSSAILQLIHPARGRVLRAWREALRARAAAGWADRAVAAIADAIAADRTETARQVPRRSADADTLIARARPFALMADRETCAMALDLIGEALYRDPAHGQAHALAAACHGQAAIHAFTSDLEAARVRAVSHAGQAIALCPDDPGVLTVVATAMSFARRLDEAESIARRSLGLQANQPAAWLRLGFIENWRGNAPFAARFFRRAYHAGPHSPGGGYALLGMGVATFMLGDYPRSARLLTRVLERHTARAWPHRFLTAASMRAGAPVAARRSLTALRHAYPDLTVGRLARSAMLPAEPISRVLDSLADAGLPRD